VPSQPLAVRHNRVAVESHCESRNVDSDIDSDSATEIEIEIEIEIDIDIENRQRQRNRNRNRTPMVLPQRGYVRQPGVVDHVNYPWSLGTDYPEL
jgi:hypothetical protein